MSFRDPRSLLVRAICRRFAGRSIKLRCNVVVISVVATITLAAHAQTTEKLTSPDGRYSVEIVRNAEDSLVLSKGGEAITKIPTSAGPVGSLFEALWRPDGSYVAINKQRSSRPGGDYVWVIALPSGKVLKQPDDSVAQAWEKTATKAIERHFAGIEKERTQGKEFLSIKATGWQDGQLQFLVQQDIAGINVAAEYRFAATADPRTLTSITSSKVSNPSGAATREQGFTAPRGHLTTLLKFSGRSGPNKGTGGNPLIQARDGNFYGTTKGGGTQDYGTVFKMTPQGRLTTLVEFTGKGSTNRGLSPDSALVQGRDGNLYGTTEGMVIATGSPPEHGTVFKITPDGALTTLVEFTFDAEPNKGHSPSGLIEGSDGNFYGTTDPAGKIDGMLFKITPEGVLTTVAKFPRTSPGSVIQGSDGNFYGATSSGGATGSGTVFKITPEGVVTTLTEFNNESEENGIHPFAGVVEGDDGNLYGTTFEGGTENSGTVFKLTKEGVLTTLVRFTGTKSPNRGRGPNSLIKSSNGDLYGTTVNGDITYGGGTIFKLTPRGVLTTLYEFTKSRAATQGLYLRAALVQGADGNLYGTTLEGGKDDQGTVFKLDLNHREAPKGKARRAHDQ